MSLNGDLSSISAFSVYNKNKTLPKKSKSRNFNKQQQTKRIGALKRKCVDPENQQQTLVKSNINGDLDVENIPKLVKIQKTPKKVVKKKTTKNLVRNESVELLDDPYSESVNFFKWIITPQSSESFFSDYWEKQPLHIIRHEPTYYSNILNSDVLDKMLRENPLYYTKNVDVVLYENGEKQTFNKEGRAMPSALWDYYSNGCSIRILNPQTYNYKVHLLIATLEEYFGAMVGTNVYLTPPNSQGFAPHYDDIEAFVVQLEGRKHWKLYKPKTCDILARYSSPNFSRDEIGEPFMELTLESGDLLYFPRGTIHEGFTSDSHSLHITISVYQNTSYVDLLERIVPQALKKASEDNPEFRKGLPLGYLKHLGHVNNDKRSPTREEVVKKVKELCTNLIDYLDVDEGTDELGKKFICDSMPPVLSKGEIKRTSRGDGDYLSNGKVFNRVEICLDTKVRLLRYHCVRLVKSEGESPKLYYNSENANVYHGEDEQWLELDESMIELVTTLQHLYPAYVAIDDLPMDDQIVKLQLVMDLWEHGLIVTKDSLQSFE